MNKKNIIKKVRVYFVENDIFHSIESETDTEIICEQYCDRDFDNYNYFELFKGYDANLQGLQQYYRDFTLWCDELETEDIIYRKYMNHLSAVYFTLLRFSTRDLNKHITMGYDGIEDININEFMAYENCPNGGLMSIDKTLLNKELEVHGKDFSAFYPNMLANSDLRIPIKQGKKSKVSDFKKALKYGIYKCEITCKDEQFKKLFAFEKNNFYTHFSIMFCLKHKKTFGIEINVLDLDKEYNCIVYENEDLIDCVKIFGGWFKKLSEIKLKYPKNKLIKHLLSSVWGSLSQYNRTIIKSHKEYCKLDVSYLNDNDDTEYKLLDTHEYVDENFNIQFNYEVINAKKPYRYNWRIKPFLTAYSRRYVAEFILNNIDLKDVVRVYVDSVCLLKDYDFTKLKYYPITEQKSTGKIIFKNLRDYEKLSQ